MVAAVGFPASAQQTDTQQAPATDVQQQQPVQPVSQTKPAPTKSLLSFGKGTKEIYTGPTNIVELPPAPMLDEEGKQRLDPDGKPMFNLPVKQQRDKKGHPLFDDKGKPVFQTATELGYDETGHKLHAEKVKPPKMTPVSIAGGTFTVDGVVGKAQLNYDIADLKYIYFFAPGIGITVVSNEPFPGAKEQPNAFDGQTLTVSVGDHTLQLYSDKRLLQDKKTLPAYVLVDRDFNLPSRYPVMGYGDLRKAPYAWPGAKQVKIAEGTAVIPPPVPINLRPVLLQPPCPAGADAQACAESASGPTCAGPAVHSDCEGVAYPGFFRDGRFDDDQELMS